MKILSTQQVRQWDEYTIQHEPVASVDLMERAATACFDWLEANHFLSFPFTIFCGKGNNGGDGLALARLLWRRQVSVTVLILEFGHKGTEDFQLNLGRLHETDVPITFIQSADQLQPVAKNHLVVDALFGSGLNRPPSGIAAELIRHINASGNAVISIDLPSGLYADATSLRHDVVRANHTLSFQAWKLCFLVAENEQFVGKTHLLDIGLHPAFYETLRTDLEIVDLELVQEIYRPRRSFSHKGSYGHALLMGGSFGKIGALVLSARACLRSGVGLLTCQIPECGYTVMQTAVPEAMVVTDNHMNVITKPASDPGKYQAVGIGPGMGTAEATLKMFSDLLSGLERRGNFVFDADALNMLGLREGLLQRLPRFALLTPHPREFERLCPEAKGADDFTKIELARQLATRLQIIIILKSHRTFIAMPGGKGYFNATGNPGMATGGSGDVLTGILTGLLAQGYAPDHAAILGVYLHGLAGDLASAALSQESLLASDIIDYLPMAFKTLALR